MGKSRLVALLNLSSWCLVMVERLFLAVPWGCLRFVIVVFPDHTHSLLFLFIAGRKNKGYIITSMRFLNECRLTIGMVCLCWCLHPSQQCFSHVETLPGLSQY